MDVHCPATLRVLHVWHGYATGERETRRANGSGETSNPFAVNYPLETVNCAGDVGWECTLLPHGTHIPSNKAESKAIMQCAFSYC
jgi:hypothetical protein